MEPTTEKNDVNMPLFAFNTSLIVLIISLGILIYNVNTKEVHVAEQKEVRQEISFIIPKIEGDSFIVFDINSGNVLASKNEKITRPLASVTKIMSALVARDMLPKDSNIVVRKEFLEEEGDSGLRDGEVFKLSDLLDFSLMVSSNDGARSIASVAGAFKLGNKDYTLGRKEFIREMNLKAQELGLNTLSFTNESGLDNPDGSTGGYGSAEDIAKLFSYILQKYPDLLEVTHNTKETFFSEQYSHEAVNTNVSMSTIPNIIASKTGFTSMAGGNLAVVFDAGFGRPIAVVVLGSTTSGRFKDVAALASSTLQYLKQ
ncbi:MAG: D-alanyl-D-alanine carboxypeptidase family protein [Minisyncoccota bacterium]